MVHVPPLQRSAGGEGKRHVPPLVTFICGGLAGSVAKTAIAPMDRVKIIFQTAFHKPFSFSAAWAEGVKIVRREGALKLWRGNGATLVRVYPYSGTQFLSFDLLKHHILRNSGRSRLTPGEKFLAGGVAGALSVLVTYPLDVARARLAVQRDGREVYTGLRHALRSMYSTGGVAGLYRGIVPTLLGIVPYSGLSFATYHHLQQVVVDAFPHTAAGQGSSEAAGVYKVACGALAGLVGQSAAYPLEVARRVVQTWGFMHESKGGTPESAGEGAVARGHLRHGASHAKAGAVPPWHEVVRELYSHHGRGALWKGLALNWVKGPIATSISFVMFDVLKDVTRGL